MNRTKCKVLISALALILAVVSIMFAVNACKKKKEDPPKNEESGVNVTVGDFGKYNRGDKTGTSVKSTVALGQLGDLSSYISLNSVVTLGDKLYLSDETGKKIYKLSTDGKLEKTYTSDRQINRVVTDGKNIYSLEGAENSRVVKLNSDFEVSATLKVGHTPSDMVFASGKGYVVNRFSGNVSVVSLSDMKLKTTVLIDGREPSVAVAIGNDVYVACHLPDESTKESVMSANVAIISANDDKVTKTLELVNGSSGVKGICVSPDNKTVYVAHIVARYAYPTTQLDRAWINSNGVSIIDTANKSVKCTVLLDEVDHGAANPWGIKVSSDGQKLSVALSGLNEIMVVDINKMNIKIDNVANKKNGRVVDTLDDIVNYLPFLNDCRERITVGVGVRNIAEKDGTLYCANYFDGTVSKVKLSDKSVKTLKFIEQPKASEVRQGQILWSDANNCYQKWQSCNSCHPDAIIDGFNWDNLNDGLGGGGKSAKSMLYAHRTPPVMVTGIRPDAETAVAAGMKYIQFNTLEAIKLSYIDEYLKSLYPISSPYLADGGKLTESAQSGKELFENNCSSCHPAPLYTDMKKHDVGSNNFSGDSGEYDTPTLVEVWRTAPYMHDGSLYTLEEVVKFFAKDLSESDVKKLADYVRSISNVDELYAAEQIICERADKTLFYNIYENGASVKSITVRNQSVNSPETVAVALSVYDKNGKQTAYSDIAIKGLVFNSSAVITLDKPVTLPDGGYYTVAFYSTESGKMISSPFTVK